MALQFSLGVFVCVIQYIVWMFGMYLYMSQYAILSIGKQGSFTNLKGYLNDLPGYTFAGHYKLSFSQGGNQQILPGKIASTQISQGDFLTKSVGAKACHNKAPTLAPRFHSMRATFLSRI